MYVVYLGGGKNPWDGAMYGPFETREEANVWIEKWLEENDDEIIFIPETGDVKYAEDHNIDMSDEYCILVQELKK